MIAIRELVDEVRLVTESELVDAIRILLLDEHVVAEASGAAATAAFLQMHPITPMPRLYFWSPVRMCLRMFFVERSPRNFDSHYESYVRKCACTF